MKIEKIMIVLIATAFAMASFTVEAVPSFARDSGKNCSYCHNAWPQLNSKGRAFKEHGYRFPDAERMSFKEIAEEGTVPVSALIYARPYDKKDSSDEVNMRAIHEVELVVAGAVGKYWSGFFEIESEDEAQNDYGFDVGVPAAVLSYNHSDALNLSLIWGQMLWSDPYGFIGDHLRLTRGRVATIDKSYDGNDGTVRSRRQTLALSGRPISPLFYSVGISAQADSSDGSDSTDVSEGKEPSTLHARVAFDVTPDIMVGGFVIDGEVAGIVCTGPGAPDAACTAAGDIIPGRPNNSGSTGSLDYQRLGLDAQADFGGSRVQVMYVDASSDQTGAATGVESDNTAISVQAYHVFKTSSGMPTWVPLIRYDTYEMSDGTDTTDELTLNLTYYFEQNIKGYVEYWDRSAENSANDDDRLTVQLGVGF